MLCSVCSAEYLARERFWSTRSIFGVTFYQSALSVCQIHASCTKHGISLIISMIFAEGTSLYTMEGGEKEMSGREKKIERVIGTLREVKICI